MGFKEKKTKTSMIIEIDKNVKNTFAEQVYQKYTEDKESKRFLAMFCLQKRKVFQKFRIIWIVSLMNMRRCVKNIFLVTGHISRIGILHQYFLL